MNNMTKKNQTLVVCAVLAGVVVVLNFVSSLHLIRLDAVFFLVSGALVYFAATRFGVRSGLMLFVAASLLSFVLVPDKVWLLFFIGVFGPAAILQSYTDKRLNRFLSAAITIASFLGLFYLFGYIAFYESGFIPRINLPVALSIPGVVLIAGFAVLSSVVAVIVNRGLYELLKRRLGGRLRNGDAKTKIVLPKLSPDDEGQEND